VNATAARLVAGGVALGGLLYVASGSPLVLVMLAYGFAARAVAGPRWSPLGRAAVAVAPRLRAVEMTAGAPKQFAQLIGVAFTWSAAVLALAGWSTASRGVVAALVVAATLEAVAGRCIGCAIWARAHRAGFVDERCDDCDDLARRTRTA
jgi:hypothetical protein